jgi:chromosome segregation ATPase
MDKDEVIVSLQDRMRVQSDRISLLESQRSTALYQREQAQAEIERLKAGVEASQDGGARLWHKAAELRDDLEQAQARVKRLEEALRRYGRHGGACLDETACDCGLEAALAEGGS